jgi:phospholipid/cholesterol/gamma-HCH transport system substrate-binding protein
MRRIALLTALLGALAAWVTSMAGASDSHTYHVEMYNAFGIVNGSNVRIAGVDTGTVTDLDITPEKRADLTIETSGPLGALGKDTRCASQPQSLIAEYFLTCKPKGPPLEEGGTIPAKHVTETVQPDLVQNTLREPFKNRLAILINEFGTALAGNPEDLNEAIRLGSPALQKLKTALHILASENRTIRDLNANSDAIITQLANRRQDVISFIQHARDTAAISASRREDLSTDFDRLDDFLAQLKPTLAKLGTVATQQEPLLTNLRLAAPGLNTLALKLPGFNEATDRSLTSLGKAAIPGRQALEQGKDEIQALARSGRNAYPATNTLDKFLLDLDSPKRVVEIDQRAARSCDNKSAPCWSTGRKAPTGYTGFEGLLNYAYYQTGAINNYDQYGHVLHVPIYDFGVNPCSHGYNSGDNPADDAPPEEIHKIGVPDATGEGTTTRLADANACVSWLGTHQPGINQDIGSPPYDPSVCPNGSTDLSLCNPAGTSAAEANADGSAGSSAGATAAAPESGSGTAPAPGTTPPVPPTTGQQPPGPVVPPTGTPGTGGVGRHLRDILGLGGHGKPDVGGAVRRHTRKPGGGRVGGNLGGRANHLLNYLFAP